VTVREELLMLAGRLSLSQRQWQRWLLLDRYWTRRRARQPTRESSLRSRSMTRLIGVLGTSFAVALVASISGGSTAAAVKASAPVPLIGANYTHYVNPNCSLDYGIVTHYDWPGVRRRVRAQLAAMRAAGIQSLRLLLWYMSDATGQNWGIVSSAGGRLAEPYRSNLIHYLSDVRQSGIEQLTLAFGPTWTNDPLGTNYDPAMFEEDWAFVRDVRPLLKRYGPPSTRVDLMSEGAPPSWLAPEALAQDEDWIRRMWSNYVDTFGSADASLSSVGADGPYDTADRIKNLIDALRASGRPIPSWFDIHPAYTYDGTLSTLEGVDQLLTRDGLSQALVIGEEAYNDGAVARAIAQFTATSSRRVLEVMEWPLGADRRCKDMSVSPPYRVDAYITALSGTPPSTALTARVTPDAITLRTPYHQPVTALEAGQYQIIVNDKSLRTGFQLTGPGVNRKTGRRFHGSGTWRLNLRLGTYRYQSEGAAMKLQHRFRVLNAG
jgi:hypothetical protein